jgi:hypothetical protein
MKNETQAMSVDLNFVLAEFEKRSGIRSAEYEIKSTSRGDTLLIKLANPSERFFKILEEILALLPEDSRLMATLEKNDTSSRLSTPETRYFSQVLSESLNINRSSFGEDFLDRYTKSVSNAEEQVTALANHMVLGRRGAGKSSLLLYCLRSREKEGKSSIWLDMQTYESRSDLKVILDVLSEIILQQSNLPSSLSCVAVLEIITSLRNKDDVTESDIRQILPRVRSVLTPPAGKNTFVFLDDFHVIDPWLQPTILSILYACGRGNNVFYKLSAIESLIRPWDAKKRIGLQGPHDAQNIKLDYNLTTPEKAAQHIEGILNAHAVYSGLPSVRYLCTSPDVISRLVWVSAGVPRDALNLFSLGMNKGVIQRGNRVSVSNVNMAASEMVTQKMKDIDIDAPGAALESSLKALLDQLRDFCIKQERKNAFLIEIDNESLLNQQIKQLIDLRLVHVISEGITPGLAGRKFMGLILDYGFYTGVRAAQSVDLFNKQSKQVSYSELRKLPVFYPKEN